MNVKNFHAAEEAYRQAAQLLEKVSDLKAVADVRVSLGESMRRIRLLLMPYFSGGKPSDYTANSG